MKNNLPNSHNLYYFLWETLDYFCKFSSNVILIHKIYLI